jgi:hypothetical protein
MDAIIVHWRVPAAQEAGTVWSTAGGNSGETAAATLCAEIATNSAAEEAVDQVLVLVPATTVFSYLLGIQPHNCCFYEGDFDA